METPRKNSISKIEIVEVAQKSDENVGGPSHMTIQSDAKLSMSVFTNSQQESISKIIESSDFGE